MQHLLTGQTRERILTPETAQLFAAQCHPISPTALDGTRRALRNHLAELQEALHNNEFLDINTARQIATVLELLLADYGSFSQEHQAVIGGAVAYFLANEDSEPDLESIVGFDDDRQVLNYVLTVIGWDDYRI